VAKAYKILAAARNNPEGVALSDLRKLVLAAGFAHKRTDGSHEVYGRKDVPEVVGLQPRKHDKRMAKIYQVRQVVDIIDKYKIEVT
jgi:predicted RNA binding protein YcfA (HicA-like mRNA interferase family)